MRNKLWYRQKLGVRLALVCFAWSLLVSILVTMFQVHQVWREAKAQAAQELAAIEKTFIPALTDALWTLDPNRTAAQLNALKQLPNVARLELTDDSKQKTVIDVRPLTELLAQRHYELRINVEGQDFRLGTLHITLDTAELYQQLGLVARSSLITSFIALFLSCLLLQWLFYRWVALQLKKVTDYTTRLNRDNMSEYLVLPRSNKHDQDEIGNLVVALTEMQQQLLREFELRTSVELELKSHQVHLEELVLERTHELEQQKQKLEQQSVMLKEQNTELDAFAHTVAHDLKHPLTNLIGMSTLLSQAFDALDQKKQQEFLARIIQSSHKMNNIINSLLQLSSLRHDADSPVVEVDIAQTIRNATKQLASFVEEHHAVLAIQEGMPSAKGQSQWIEQIWLNYISNAVKYGGQPASIEIGYTLDSPSGFCQFWVKDHGKGVPEDKVGQLFAEFNKLDSVRLDSHGLGLSIVRRICQKLGGFCGYESAAEGGSRFWFTLPTAASALASS